MIYAFLKMDIILYNQPRLKLFSGQLVRIDNHRNGDELYLLNYDTSVGFFPKGYLRYYTVKPSKLLNLVMK